MGKLETGLIEVNFFFYKLAVSSIIRNRTTRLFPRNCTGTRYSNRRDSWGNNCREDDPLKERERERVSPRITISGLPSLIKGIE